MKEYDIHTVQECLKMGLISGNKAMELLRIEGKVFNEMALAHWGSYISNPDIRQQFEDKKSEGEKE